MNWGYLLTFTLVLNHSVCASDKKPSNLTRSQQEVLDRLKHLSEETKRSYPEFANDLKKALKAVGQNDQASDNGAGAGPGPVILHSPPRDLPRQEVAPASNNSITIDLSRGAAPQIKDAGQREKLEAVVFAINSLNITTPDLLTVDDVIKKHFSDGKLPANAKVTINLGNYLNETQIDLLQRLVQRDAFTCSDEALEKGVSADRFVSTAFKPQNYNKLMQLDLGRRNFEVGQGVPAEFGIDPVNKDTRVTSRMVLAPGDSKVAHPECYRSIVIQKGKNGEVIRTKDVDKHRATELASDFANRPASSEGQFSEGIWELKNGMRGYGAWDADGNAQESVPVTAVRPQIINPTSCMGCHSSGYIATTGKGTSLVGAALKKVELNFQEPGFSRKFIESLYDMTTDDYARRIDSANDRFTKAKNKSKTMAPREFMNYSEGLLKSEVRLDELAKEFGVKVEVLSEQFSDARFANVISKKAISDAMATYRKSKKPEDLPRLKWIDLERSVVASPRGRLDSLYCTLRQRVLGSNARRNTGSQESWVIEPKRDEGAHKL